jgi:hypothetical protein
MEAEKDVPVSLRALADELPALAGQRAVRGVDADNVVGHDGLGGAEENHGKSFSRYFETYHLFPACPIPASRKAKPNADLRRMCVIFVNK